MKIDTCPLCSRAKLIGHMSPKERRNAICDIGDEFRVRERD